ncbi:MAG: phosphoribosylglycinamide formyltransferase, partial [Acidimicrobiia bacterium]|nr:phosphoribosylglycinamide formyltransferase [Acidimicrobiia bacterium]
SRIVLVVSDRPAALALDRAESHGIPTEVVSWTGDRDSFTRRVCDVVDSYGAESMVLAGFMRILGAEAIARFPHRIINVHPSLLPAFPGAHAVEAALEYGVKVAGATVHFVDERVDHGAIIDQRVVSVLAYDTAESLHRRIQEVEHEILPAAMEALAAGRLEVSDRRVTWR